MVRIVVKKHDLKVDTHNVKRDLILHALVVICGIWNRMWIFCGDYTYGVFDLHLRGLRDSVYDQSKMKMLPPMNTTKFFFNIL